MEQLPDTLDKTVEVLYDREWDHGNLLRWQEEVEALSAACLAELELIQKASSRIDKEKTIELVISYLRSMRSYQYHKSWYEPRKLLMTEEQLKAHFIKIVEEYKK